jgi:acyl-coenzyme A thioesterase 13
MEEKKNKVIQFFKDNVGKSMKFGPSGMGGWLDGLLVEAEEGALSAEFEVRKDMSNPLGRLHGGAIAAIMDDLIGATVYSMGIETPYVSLNLAIDYLRSAKIGDKVTAKAKVIRPGQTIMHTECHLYDIDGKLLAKCTSNLAKTNSHSK